MRKPKYNTILTMLFPSEQEVKVEYKYWGSEMEIVSARDLHTGEEVTLTPEQEETVKQGCYDDMAEII